MIGIFFWSLGFSRAIPFSALHFAQQVHQNKIQYRKFIFIVILSIPSSNFISARVNKNYYFIQLPHQFN